MEIEYDEESDAAFVWIAGPESQVIQGELWPEELKRKIGLLFDADERLIGIEVLQASVHLPKESLKTET